jgi:uncharacterized protein YjbI with pentapeptide repeats
MANQEQLAILKQGVEVWNKWRMEKHPAKIDLIEADLRKANLENTNLSEADLSEANLENAYASEANLRNANLFAANLFGTILSNSDLSSADLRNANLSEADLIDTNLADSLLIGTNLSKARVGATIFSGVNLGQTLGLEEVIHYTSSVIDTHTLQRSSGKIPAAFLRGCGLSDLDIESAKLYNLELSNDEINNILHKIHNLRAR